MHTLRLLWAAHNEEVWVRRRQSLTMRRSVNRQICEMPEELFRHNFRLSKVLFRRLCAELRSVASLRGTSEISIEVKVLCTLSFLATGSYQRIVGVTQHLPQRTASRCIRQVVTALNNSNLLKKYIKFPQTQIERSIIRQEFQRRFNLPGVIGCIDCTHIALVKPDSEEHLYFNRKGYHSLNVQMICDHNLKIMNVNSKFGGATHDSFILASSQVEPFMRGLHQNGEQTWLLGDSGYPQRAWLMTPILHAAPGSQEDIYTRRHIQARNSIERCFGLLKARWRCLLKHRTLHYHPHVASEIVHACSVLHNMALEARLPAPTDTEQYLNVDDIADVQAGSSVHSTQEDIMRGRAMLSCLVHSL